MLIGTYDQPRAFTIGQAQEISPRFRTEHTNRLRIGQNPETGHWAWVCDCCHKWQGGVTWMEAMTYAMAHVYDWHGGVEW